MHARPPERPARTHRRTFPPCSRSAGELLYGLRVADPVPGPEAQQRVGAPLPPDASPAPPQPRRPPAPTSAVFVNPVLDTGAGHDHGDPFVLRWHGRYVLYYTGVAGIEAWTSDDLVHWSREGLALVAPDGDHWAQIDLWAPEVLYADGWFWMYVTGTRHLHPGVDPTPGVGVDAGDDALRRQGIARARHPLGPFTLYPRPLLGVWSIDGHPFVDLDGRRWLFYNVRDETTRFHGTTSGCGNVVDELVAPSEVSGNPSPVALPDAAWEGNRGGTWFWNEGPTVLRHRDRYVQMYSGGGTATTPTASVSRSPTRCAGRGSRPPTTRCSSPVAASPGRATTA